MINQEELEELNQDVYEKAHVDREHLMKFLTLIPTSEAPVIIKEVESWLKSLHDDPHYSKVSFPQGDINAVIGDLDSYGRVQPLTIQQFKQDSNKAVPMTS